MDGELGADLTDEPHEPQVLNQHRIHARGGHPPHDLLHAGQLVGKHQRIKRNVGLHLPPVQEGDQLVEHL